MVFRSKCYFPDRTGKETFFLQSDKVQKELKVKHRFNNFNVFKMRIFATLKRKGSSS